MKLIPIKASKLKVGQKCYSTPDEESQGDRVMGKTIHIITKDGCIQHAFPTDTVYVEAKEKQCGVGLCRTCEYELLHGAEQPCCVCAGRDCESQWQPKSVPPQDSDAATAKESLPVQADVVEASRIPIATWFEFVNDRGEGKCVVVSQRPRDDYEVQYISTRLCGVERCMGICLVRRIPNPIEAGQKAIEQRDKLVAAIEDDELYAEAIRRQHPHSAAGFYRRSLREVALAKAGIPEAKP